MRGHSGRGRAKQEYFPSFLHSAGLKETAEVNHRDITASPGALRVPYDSRLNKSLSVSEKPLQPYSSTINKPWVAYALPARPSFVHTGCDASCVLLVRHRPLSRPATVLMYRQRMHIQHVPALHVGPRTRRSSKRQGRQ